MLYTDEGRCPRKRAPRHGIRKLRQVSDRRACEEVAVSTAKRSGREIGANTRRRAANRVRSGGLAGGGLAPRGHLPNLTDRLPESLRRSADAIGRNLIDAHTGEHAHLLIRISPDLLCQPV